MGNRLRLYAISILYSSRWKCYSFSLHPTIGISRSIKSRRIYSKSYFTVKQLAKKNVELGQLFQDLFIFRRRGVCVCLNVSVINLCPSAVLFLLFGRYLFQRWHPPSGMHYAKVNYVFQLRIRRRLFVLLSFHSSARALSLPFSAGFPSVVDSE